MRPFGYNMQDGGRWHFLTRKIPSDTVYPALLTLMLVCTLFWQGLRLLNNRLLRAGVMVSLSAAFFDYVANLGVAVMILSSPYPSNGLIHATSTAII